MYRRGARSRQALVRDRSDAIEMAYVAHFLLSRAAIHRISDLMAGRA